MEKSGAMSLVPCDRIFEEDNEEVMNNEQKRSNNKEIKAFKRAAEITAHISSLVSFVPLNTFQVYQK